MIRRGEFKFIHSPADPDQLFDLKRDPGERDNLADKSEHAALRRRLSRRGREALGSRRTGRRRCARASAGAGWSTPR